MREWVDEWWYDRLAGERMSRQRQAQLDKTSLPLLAAQSHTPWVLNWKAARAAFLKQFGQPKGNKA